MNAAIIKTAGLMAALISLAGCAGMSEQECLATDWRTIGFEDGTRGRAVGSIGGYRQACSKYGIAPDLDSYRTGHAEGVEIYCRPANGFDAGRRGVSYRGICPAGLEADFLAAYNAGRRLHELQSNLSQIESRIAGNTQERENIKHELTDIGVAMANGDIPPEDRIQMVAHAAELGARFSQLGNESELLEDQRIVAAQELLDYQDSLNGNY